MTPLPHLLMLTDRHLLPVGRRLVEQVQGAVDGGLRAVVLRERDLPADQRAELSAALTEVLDEADGILIAASPWIEGTAGVHLQRDEAIHRPPRLVGRSCHDIGEVSRAADDGADYITLSPVARSSSKPGYGPPFGPSGLQDTLARVPDAPAVFALGGVTPTNASRWRGSGAYGVAVMGALMEARNPSEVVRRLSP